MRPALPQTDARRPAVLRLAELLARKALEDLRRQQAESATQKPKRTVEGA